MHLLKKYIQNIDSLTTKFISKNNLITDCKYVIKTQGYFKIKFTDTESVDKISQCKDIIKINVVTNIINTIDTILDTVNINISQNIYEKCETNYFDSIKCSIKRF